MNNNHHLKLLFVNLFFIIHLFFNNSVCSSIPTHFKNADLTIDSLLLEGDVVAVKVKYDDHEYESYSAYELQVLFRNVDLVTTFDLNRMNEYVSHYRTLAPQYYIEYVGDNAYKAYEKFLQLSNQMAKAEALKYYYISLFFKIHHFNTVLISARDIYTKADKLFSEGKFNKALNTINSLKIYSGRNFHLIAIEDSLELLRKKIINNQNDYDRWHTTDLRTYKLFIGILPSFIKYGAVSDVTLKIDNAVYSFLGRIQPSDLKEVHIGNIPPANAYELSLGINYLVLRKLMIGLDFGYTALSMDSEYNTRAYEDKIFYEFKLRSYILKPYIKYLFSETIGFIPFVNVGIGYQMIHYDDAIAGLYGWYAKYEYGNFASKSENRIGVISEIGLEYISSISTSLIFGSKVGGYYFFSQRSVLNNYNITFSLYAGLIL